MSTVYIQLGLKSSTQELIIPHLSSPPPSFPLLSLTISSSLLYHPPLPTPSQTGTLTQNIMTFLKCSIQGVKYGEAIPEDKDKEIVVSTGEVLQEKKPDSPSSVSLKIGIGCHGARVEVLLYRSHFTQDQCNLD